MSRAYNTIQLSIFDFEILDIRISISWNTNNRTNPGTLDLDIRTIGRQLISLHITTFLLNFSATEPLVSIIRFLI